MAVYSCAEPEEMEDVSFSVADVASPAQAAPVAPAAQHHHQPQHPTSTTQQAGSSPPAQFDMVCLSRYNTACHVLYTIRDKICTGVSLAA